MPLETATYLSDLVQSNPAPSDPMAAGDDHIRLIKAVLQNTLPGLSGPLMRTPGGIILPTDGTASAPGYAFASEGTLGFYRSAAGVVTLAGGVLRGNGAARPGSVHLFLNGSTVIGAGGTGSGWEYLELDGSTWPIASFPDLAAFLGVTSGTTFTLPKMTDTGRFPRSRIPGITAAGVAQTNTVGPHTHPDVTVVTGNENQAHNHGFSGTTGADFPDHSHNAGTFTTGGGVTGGGSFALPSVATTESTSGATARHQHNFSGTTNTENQNHNHNASVNTPANTGTTETRPEAMSFVFAVKT